MFKPLKLKLVLILFNTFNSAITVKETYPITIKKLKWLILFKKTTAVYSENYMKLVNTLREKTAESLIVKSDGTYSYH